MTDVPSTNLLSAYLLSNLAVGIFTNNILIFRTLCKITILVSPFCRLKHLLRDIADLPSTTQLGPNRVKNLVPPELANENNPETLEDFGHQNKIHYNSFYLLWLKGIPIM